MKHLILGNGPAGVIAAETLRKAAPADDIVLVGDEHEPPYSRMAIPYLLEGNIGESGTWLRKTAGHFDALRIRSLHARAIAVDCAQRTVRFSGGHTEPYDRLLVATGSHPLCPPIPGVDRPGVLSCWTLADARAIAERAQPGARVLQLGAGFIGCIIMEALAKRGVDLTVVEMGDRLVPRMMTPKAGGMIRRWVEGKGVRVRTGAGVQAIEAGAGDTLVASLSTGEQVECDLLIVAAGVAPNVAFLEGTGVQVDKGIVVDSAMRSSVPGVFAAGDVAQAPDLFTGEATVAAIQPNAADQARVAALNMVRAEHELPARHDGVLAINVLDTLGLISSSFGQWWGEQVDAGGAGVELVDEARFRYLSLQFREDVLIGATSVGLTEHVGALRGLIQARVKLGGWKERLLQTPLQFPDAYVACALQPMALAR